MTRTNVLASLLYRTAVNLKNISLSQTEEIISVLCTSYGYNAEELSNALKEATAVSDYSDEYEELLFEMHFLLSECVNSIAQTRKGYIDTISRYIKAFHNYPRAFLSLADKSKISPKDAIEYSKSYLKLD